MTYSVENQAEDSPSFFSREMYEARDFESNGGLKIIGTRVSALCCLRIEAKLF